MNSAEDQRRAPTGGTPRSIDAFLAGLQAGTLGTLWMLAWMGLSATWQRRSFWSAENLMASALHPREGIAGGFGWNSVSGVALYLFVYGLLGGLFGILVARHHLRPARLTWMAVAFGLAWYYFSFHLLWQAVSPAIALLHPEQSTVAGHLIYGLILGRFSTHLRPAGIAVPANVAQSGTAPDSLAPGT